MKKNFVLLVLFIITTLSVNAQDLIVTKKGDSINCYVDIKRSNIRYRIGTPCKNGVKWRKIHMKNIASFHQQFYKENPAVTESDFKNDKIYPRWMFAINYGYAQLHSSMYKTGNPSLKELKKGTLRSIQVIHFMNRKYGLGLLLKEHYAKTSIEGVTYKNSLKHLIATLSYQLFMNKKKNALLFTIGTGMIFANYKSNFNMNKYGFTLYSEIGYNHSITKNWALGVNMNYTFGKINLFPIIENSSHLGFSAGIRYLLW